MRTGDVEAALDVLAEAVRLAPEDTYALDWRAGCLLRLGRPWSAATWLRRAAAIDPSPPTWRRLAPVLSTIGDSREALEIHRRLIARDPNDWRALYSAGIQLRDLERFDEAQEVFRRCTEVRPDFAEGWCNLGWVHFDDGEIELAIECFERGHALGSASEGWRYPSADWVALARRTQRDIARLDELARTGLDPADPRALEIVESARLAGRTVLASQWYGRLAASGAGLTTLDLLLATQAALDASEGIGTDARGLGDRERVALLDTALSRLELLRERLMASFRAAPVQEWSAVRSFLLHFRRVPAFEPLRGEDVPARFASRVRDFWAAIDAGVAEIEAYAAANH